MKICLACNQRFASTGWTCPNCGGAPAEGDLRSFVPFEDDIAGSFPADAAPQLALLEARSFWFRARNDLLLWALGRYFSRATSFLEVGCGTGFVLAGLHARLPDFRLVGGELDPEGLRVARRRLPEAVDLYRMDARLIPFEAEFDVVGAFDVLEHVDDDERVLQQLAMAVRPGGGVLVTVPQHPSLWSASDDVALHRRRYTRSELLAKLDRAGLDVVRVTSFVTLLLPGMLLNRKRIRSGEDAMRECALPPGLDRWLERTMRAERSLIRAGVSFPVGGSLLVVAKTRAD
jgi:SAM-dependent methyltransferase